MKTHKVHISPGKHIHGRTAAAEEPKAKVLYLWEKGGITRIEFFTGNTPPAKCC